MITLSVDDQQEITRLMQIMLAKIAPNDTHLTARTIPQAMELLDIYDVQVVFLDIEMPGTNGLDAAKIMKKYDKLNIIFVTGHPEYSLEAYGVHPSGFLVKPICESDIIRELNNLRFPIEAVKCPLKVQCEPFTVFNNGKPFDFSRDRTLELFAYLIYKQGAFCTNGEILGILWDGDPNKDGHLRQLILDMRKCLQNINSEYILLKKYGKIGINIKSIEIVGDPSKIADEYCWL